LPLHYPENPGTRIATMKGTLVYTVETQSRHVDLKLPEGAPAIMNLEGMIVTFIKYGIKPNTATAAEVIIKLERGEMDKAQWEARIRKEGVFSVRMQLLDAAGVAARNSNIPGPGFFNRGGADDEGTYTFRRECWFPYWPPYNNRDQKFTPDKFRITITTKTREVSVPIEFRDIPLPPP
ncbi:MAG: hypothetical protein FWD53_05185, partial [Phycisphaerales bacterium]|nr:hypothetical protein [Phycisphaerales bacterium]